MNQSRMNRRNFLKLAATGAAAAAAPWAARARAAAKRKPNIVYILADDLGYGDLGCYGQDKIKTPVIDRLAAEGMRFTDHYSGSTVCAPSRCVLMTGLHSGHARIRGNSTQAIEPDDLTVAEILKREGYATGGFGKWSLGEADTTGAPNKQGFDYFFGYLNQSEAHFYYPEFMDRNQERYPIPENRDGKRAVYSHDLLTKEALDFLRRSKDDPFFLYVPYTIPHAEVLVPEDSLAQYKGKWPEKPYPGAHYAGQPTPRAARAAMITRMDRDVGRILALIEELGLDDNTLVIFTSDNGPITAGGQDPEFFNSAGPLRGLKFGLYEGGIRVPMIARWPGKIQAGSESDLPSAFWDMLPTFAELAGAPAPDGIDGLSILPTLLGREKKQKKHDYLYWEHKAEQALRMGDYKAHRKDPKSPIEIYNLAQDIGETKDLSKTNRDKVKQLYKILDDWRKATGAPIPTKKNPDYNPNAAAAGGRRRKK